jgi:hypothetical protein
MEKSYKSAVFFLYLTEETYFKTQEGYLSINGGNSFPGPSVSMLAVLCLLAHLATGGAFAPTRLSIVNTGCSLHGSHIKMSADDAMRSEYELLSTHLIDVLGRLPLGQHWVGIAGGPGSGKSTLAAAVASRVNEVAKDSCVVLPMDGFHYR